MIGSIEDFIKAQRSIALKKINYYKQSVKDGIDPEVLQNRIKREQRLIDCDFTKYNFATLDQAKRALELIKGSRDINYDVLLKDTLNITSINKELYDKLSLEDKTLIDEYSSFMAADKLDNLMSGMIANEIKNYNEEIGQGEVKKFINNFITTTNSQDSINDFFMVPDNFNFIIDNDLHSNRQILFHIYKFFILKNKLKRLLDDKTELISIIFDACNSFFTKKEEDNVYLIYGYINNAVRNTLLKRIDKGYNCPFCNAIYSKAEINNKRLITCFACRTKFIHLFTKCPDCEKRVPITAINKEVFDKDNIKHTIGFAGLNKYLDDEALNYLSIIIGLKKQEIERPFKFRITAGLLKTKIENNEEYDLEEGDSFTSTLPEALYYLPLICPISRNSKNETLGCGKAFDLKDGLKKTQQEDNVLYSCYEPKLAYYKNVKKEIDNFDELINFSSMFQVINNDTKLIPFDIAFNTIDKIIKDEDLKENSNKTFILFYEAMKQCILNDLCDQLDFMLREYVKKVKNIPITLFAEVNTAKNPEEIKTNKELANLFFYNNNKHKIGWAPTEEVKKEMTRIYLDMVGDNHEHARKVDTVLIAKNYTYFVNNKRDGKTKKRMGIALDKKVYFATKTAAAGYGQNFRTDKENAQLLLLKGEAGIDISEHIKSISYWSPKNAALDGFDDRTGIIWLEGEVINDVWVLPGGQSITEGDLVKVKLLTTGEGFARMILRVDVNGILKQMFDKVEEYV